MAILVQSNKKPSVTFPSLTGDIVTFNSQYAGLPLKSSKVNIPVTQEGTGDPSPDNVRNFVGVDSLNFSATGKNLLKNKRITTTMHGVTFTVNSDGTITLSGTSSSNFRYTVNSDVNLPSLKYTLSDGNIDRDVDISLFAVTPNGNKHVNRTTGYVTFENSVNSVELWIASGIDTNGFIIKPMIERGETATDYEPYNGNNKLFTFGQTIYAGELDVLTGILTVTHGYVDLGTLTWGYSNTVFYSNVIPTLNAPTNNIICSSYKTTPYNVPSANIPDKSIKCYGGAEDKNIYIKDSDYTDPAVFKTAMSGVQLVYELATPQTIQLPPCPIETLQGENNLFASTGETTASYIKIGG